MQRGHRGVLIAEFVLRPYAAFAFGAVDSVYKAVRSRLFADCARHIGVRQQARWHTWPQREHDEGDQVACSHRSTSRGVEFRASRGSICFLFGLVVHRKINAVACCGVVEEPDEEEDSARDVYEGINAVRPVHQERMLQEPVLYVKFEEDVESLLERNDLEGVPARDVDGAFDHGDGGKGTAELVYLRHLLARPTDSERKL